MSKVFKVNLSAPTINATIVNATGGDSSTSSIQATGYNQRGGVGYHGFLQATNTYGSATTPSKYFRLTSAGQLEIVNSAYTQTLFTLSDAGAMSVPSSMTAASFVKSGGTSTQYLMADGTVNTTTGNQTISSTAPVSPANGDLWISSIDGSTYIYYADGTSNQWIEVGSAYISGPAGVAIYDSDQSVISMQVFG